MRPGLQRILFGGAFDPRRIAGLKLWLKADSLSLADGDPVSSWADSSGNGNNATQATSAARPAYKAGAINNRPAVRFDHVDDYLNLTSQITVGSSCDLYFVLRWYGAPTFLDYIYRDGATFTGSAYSRVNVSNTDIGRNSGAHAINGGTLGTSAIPVVTTTTYLYLARPASLSNLIALCKGSDGVGGSFDLAEVAIYDSVLSTDDRLRVEGYLNGRYAIY